MITRRRVLGWALTAFLVFFVVHNPDGAARATRAIASGLSHAAVGLGNFCAAVTR